MKTFDYSVKTLALNAGKTNSLPKQSLSGNQKSFLKKAFSITGVSALAITANIAFGTSYSMANQDPCDFTSSSGFLPDQVLQCYSQVPVNPAVADAVAESLLYAEQTSSLSPVYARSGFPLFIRGDLFKIADNIRNLNVEGDFALQKRIQREFFRIKNSGHWRYVIPLCYQRVQPFIPIVISSRLDKTRYGYKQVVYVKNNFIFPDLYEQITGITTDDLVGKKIISIDDVPGLKAIEQFATRNTATSPFISNKFAVLLTTFGYSVPNLVINRLPSEKELVRTYVLQDENGIETTVKLPWVFIPREDILGPDAINGYPSLSKSSDDFISACQAPWDLSTLLGTLGFFDVENSTDIESLFTRKFDGDDRESRLRKKMIKRLEKLSKKPVTYRARTPSEESPLPLIIIKDETANGGGLLYGQLGDDTTVIKIETFAPVNNDLYVSTITEAVGYACDNTNSLLMDFSNNSGGSASLTAYTLALLNPELQDGLSFKYQERFPDPEELPLQASRTLGLGDTLGAIFGGCALGLEPQCALREDGTPLSSWAEVQKVPNVKRGKQRVDLTEFLTFDPFLFGAIPPTIPQLCQGKFKGANLISLVDGGNASAAAITPSALRNLGTTVAYHGLIGRKQYIGIAYGGSVESYHQLHSTLYPELLALVPDLAFLEPLITPFFQPTLPVQADFRWERPVALIDPTNLDSRELLLDQVLRVKKRLKIWDSDDLATLYTAAVHKAQADNHSSDDFSENR